MKYFIKPNHCTCGFPAVVSKTISNHEPSCPVHKETLAHQPLKPSPLDSRHIFENPGLRF